jgi:hypothetical protein
MRPHACRATGAAIASIVAICAFSGPAAPFPECADSRCAQMRRIPPPHIRKGAHDARKQVCGVEAPPGWGWYRRQKLRHDCSQPLVVFDELGDAVSVHENW